MTITNQEVVRRVQLKKARLFGADQVCSGQTKNDVDGEHSRVIRIVLCGGNKEGT